ncbi:hypothetical protein [Shewanella denitrificans]|jgi:hypothetical protein|uniref:hypothetical protein n=1 Tax=Shewanella denitrificans TaxID=192073 RepID=UPI0003020B33|nr:hypothetical protein [Shewanella denitrificans]
MQLKSKFETDFSNEIAKLDGEYERLQKNSNSHQSLSELGGTEDTVDTSKEEKILNRVAKVVALSNLQALNQEEG